MKRLIFMYFLCYFCLCEAEEAILVDGNPFEKPGYAETSLVNLIASPGDHSDDKVMIRGEIEILNGKPRVFLSDSDYRNGNVLNSVEIVSGKEGLKFVNGSSYKIFGVFNKGERGGRVSVMHFEINDQSLTSRKNELGRQLELLKRALINGEKINKNEAVVILERALEILE